MKSRTVTRWGYPRPAKVERNSRMACQLAAAYPEGAMRQLIIDLKHGCEHSTTIFADEDFDTVKISRLEWVDDRTVRGYLWYVELQQVETV